MVALIRQFLVLLLVLLQFAAPLVHAHIDEMGGKNGFHLHEFESITLPSDSWLDSTHAYSVGVQSAIVELGTAIQHQPSELDDDDATALYYLTELVAALPTRQCLKAINFSPQQAHFKTPHFLSQNLSRAPPL